MLNKLTNVKKKYKNGTRQTAKLFLILAEQRVSEKT